MSKPILFTLLLLLTSTVSAAPCWINDLTVGQKSYMYGVSSLVNLSGRSPLHYSRKNAINNWLVLNSQQQLKFKKDLSKLNSIEVANTTLHFVDDYRDNLLAYSLVSEHQQYTKTDGQCSVVSCEFETCQPSWLCPQKNAENISIFGISATTAIPNKQMQLALSNAAQIANLVEQSHVRGAIQTLNIASTHFTQANVQQQFTISQQSQKAGKAKIDGICRIADTLITEVQFPRAQAAIKHDWMTQPSLDNLTGAIGHVGSYVSSGKLSDAFELAIKRGLFNLAKAKNIKIDNTTQLHNDNGQYLLIRKSNQSVSTLVTAYLADVNMKISKDMKPEIYVWLIEDKGEL